MKVTLLIIDIQNDYFENGTMTLVNSEKACANTLQILEKFRKDKQLIIHIQHLAIRQTAGFFLPGTFGAEIYYKVKPFEQEKRIIKHFPNSFKDTPLLDYLKNNNITDIVICGMMTHMCVDSTVRAAKDLGFNITLIEDACATKNLELNGQIIKSEDVQKSFLAALNNIFANVLMTKEYLEKQ
jgi:nicotinamidase-related amidase